MSDKKAWYRKNIEYVKEYNKSVRLANPVGYLLRKAANNAQQSGREFSITREDVIIPELCPVLGIPIIVGCGSACDNSPSLDRLDNTKGYIKGNVNVISWKANKLKGSSSIEDLKKIVKWMEDNGS